MELHAHLTPTRFCINNTGNTNEGDNANDANEIRNAKLKEKGFLTLPVELRLQIYQLVVENHRCSCHEHLGESVLGCRNTQRPPLLRASRMIRKEMLPVYYGSSIVLLYIGMRPFVLGEGLIFKDSFLGAEPLLKTIDNQYLSLVKRASIIFREVQCSRIAFDTGTSISTMMEPMIWPGFSFRVNLELNRGLRVSLELPAGLRVWESASNRRAFRQCIDQHVGAQLDSQKVKSWDASSLLSLVQRLKDEHEQLFCSLIPPHNDDKTPSEFDEWTYLFPAP